MAGLKTPEYLCGLPIWGLAWNRIKAAETVMMAFNDLRPASRGLSKAAGSHARGNGHNGGAPRSGRGGRRFKSCHSDQHLAENETLTGTDCGTVSTGANVASL